MKKWIGMAVLLAAGVAQAINTDVDFAASWNSSTTPSKDPYSIDVGSAVGDGWLVQLMEYDDVSGYADFDETAVLGSGSLFSVGSFVLFNGTYSVDPGTDVYLRIFNAATVNDADYYVNLGTDYGGNYYPVDYESESANFAGFSDTTTATQANGTWIAIPEPATAGLLGISVGALWLIRRLKKAANYYRT